MVELARPIHPRRPSRSRLEQSAGQRQSHLEPQQLVARNRPQGARWLTKGEVVYELVQRYSNASPRIRARQRSEDVSRNRGTGDPLVCIPPAFGHAGVNPYPALVQNHTVITVDLQGHGRTEDIPERPLSIEQYAKDVVGLLKYLGISKADFFGESYGGNAAAMIAIRYPEFVGRVATYAATFGPPQVSLNPRTTRFDHAPAADSRNIEFQRENYKRVAADPSYWP